MRFYKWLFLTTFLLLVSCKSKQAVVAVKEADNACVEDVSRLSLGERSENCAEALQYMQSILRWASIDKLSEKQFSIDYKLVGIDNDLLADPHFLRFHLSPQCFVGLDYRDLFTPSEKQSRYIANALAEYEVVELNLRSHKSEQIVMVLSNDSHISEARWEVTEARRPSIALPDFFLQQLGAPKVSIDYTKAITGPSRKTISTKNNTLLIVTSINGDANTHNLKCLSRCYFNPHHFVGLKINAFLDVFDIESLDKESIAIISRIVVKIERHSQLIMEVEKGKVVDFRYN